MTSLKVRVKNKKLTASSKKWLERQLNDPFVHKARQEGYRSRAAFKMLEIQKKYRLLKPGMTIVDLGAAPGGWSQVAATILREKGRIVAIDLLAMDPLPGVEFYQGDFNEIDQYVEGKVDLILSDMAPSSCGIKSVDHDRIMGMLEEVYSFAVERLSPGGALVAKVLRGGTEAQLLSEMRKSFSKVGHFKPDSSRSESTEIYVIAEGFRG